MNSATAHTLIESRMPTLDLQAHFADRYRESHPLFKLMDVYGHYPWLVPYALGELEEFQEELDAPEQDYEATISEFIDMLNMLHAMALLGLGREGFQPSTILRNLNGDGAHSNFVDRMKQTILDAQDDPGAFSEMYSLAQSYINHLPPEQQALFRQQLWKVYQKVNANYPAPLYGSTDASTGDVYTSEAAKEAFLLRTQGLKKVRKQVERTLQPGDLDAELWFLLQYDQNPRVALQLIDQHLARKFGDLEVQSQQTSIFLQPNVEVQVQSNTLYWMQPSA